MRSIKFWSKLSRTSMILCAIFLIVSFFDDGIKNDYYYYFHQITLSLLLVTLIVSERIKYIL
jgi:uncharacterized membrane protein YphA (DoxX/SURF4 family)